MLQIPIVHKITSLIEIEIGSEKKKKLIDVLLLNNNNNNKHNNNNNINANMANIANNANKANNDNHNNTKNDNTVVFFVPEIFIIGEPTWLWFHLI